MIIKDLYMPDIILKALCGFSLHLYNSMKQVLLSSSFKDEGGQCTGRLSECPKHTQLGSGLARLNAGSLASESMFE